MRYIVPGAPAEPPPPSRPNSYIQPTASLQDSGRHQPMPAPTPPQRTEAQSQSEPPPARDQAALLAAWRHQHADTWVRADTLHPDVRRMIDPQDRAPAIRQKIRKLAGPHPGNLILEAKTVGNAARPVVHYRVVEGERAGLEGAAHAPHLPPLQPPAHGSGTNKTGSSK